MILINFAHPITDEQRAQIEEKVGERIADIRDVPIHFDLHALFIPQVHKMLDQVGLSAAEWQEKELLINLPSFNVIAAALLADLHGRMGHFPAVLLIRPVDGPYPKYEVSEIINLQKLRDAARGSNNAAAREQ